MKQLIVYHSKDWDGVMSGAIARIKFPKAKMLGWNYGDTVPSLEEYDTIYIMDITFPKEVMEQNYNKMVFRSKDGGANVQEYAKRFGGGGHIHAAGCLITKKDLKRIINNKVLF